LLQLNMALRKFIYDLFSYGLGLNIIT
jgi:hypothetical protein